MMIKRHTVPNYTQDRLNTIDALEDLVEWAYADSDNIPTIGLGVNLRVHLNYVLEFLGFDVQGTVLSGAAAAAERDYLLQMARDIAKPYPASSWISNPVHSALNQILQARAVDPAYAAAPPSFTRVTDFRISIAQAEAMLADLMTSGYSISSPVLGTQQHTSYESQLDNRLSFYGVSLSSELRFRDSKERLALISLAWGGINNTIRGKLGAALANDDRAEAWFEIRYNTNASGVPGRLGVANRRYKEANLFGLYNEGTLTEDDYAAAYRMYTRHRNDNIYGNVGLTGYELQFDPTSQDAGYNSWI